MWLQCQKMWLYLESIFTAPDINRQLPNEGKLFRHVDKSYKTIMRQVYTRPRALRACLQPGMFCYDFHISPNTGLMSSMGVFYIARQ